MSPRTFAEHALLVRRFASLVEALSPEAWARLRSGCRALSGTTPAALWRRAALVATPHDWSSELPTMPEALRLLPMATQAMAAGGWIVIEMLESAFPWAVDRPGTRRTTSSRPEFDVVIDARYAIDHAMARYGMREASLQAVMHAAFEALLRHDYLSPDTFRAAYRWVEAEIPFARVAS